MENKQAKLAALLISEQPRPPSKPENIVEYVLSLLRQKERPVTPVAQQTTGIRG